MKQFSNAVFVICRRQTTNSIKVPCAEAGVNTGNFMLNGIFIFRFVVNLSL